MLLRDAGIESAILLDLIKGRPTFKWASLTRLGVSRNERGPGTHVRRETVAIT